MSWELILIVAPIVLAPLLYIWKNLMSKIAEIEKNLEKKIDKMDTYNLIDDRLDPIKDDLRDIKAQTQYLIQLFIEKKK